MVFLSAPVAVLSQIIARSPIPFSGVNTISISRFCDNRYSGISVVIKPGNNTERGILKELPFSLVSANALTVDFIELEGAKLIPL